MKLWKCICRKSEFTDKGQVLIGNIYSSGEVYFKGASFHLSKEQEWEVDGTITLTREDFEKCVQKFSEICYNTYEQIFICSFNYKSNSLL